MTLFSVECITCRRRLKVNHADAIGQILACPGCGSMVEIAPPADWQAGASEAPATADDGTGQTQWAESETEQDEITAGLAETVDDFDSLLVGASIGASIGDSIDDLVPPPAADADPSAATPPPLEGIASEPLSPNAAWASPAEQQWKKRIVLGGSAVAGLAMIAGLAMYAFSDRDDPAANPQASLGTEDDSTKDRSDEKSVPKPAKKTAENPNPKKPPEDVDPTRKTEPVDPPPDIPPKKTEGPAEPLPKNPDPAPEEIPTEPTDVPEIDVPPSPPANPVDVEARLADKIPQVSFSRIGLSEFIEFLSDMSTVSITLDQDALAELRVGLDSPLSVTASDSTMADVLRKALASQKLDFVIRDGHLVVTHTAANRKPLTVHHVIEDLAADDASQQALAVLVRKMIEPKSWVGEKPIGKIAIADSRLVVTHSFSAHYKILRLLERLRKARGIPPRNKFYAASVFDLKSPMARASKRLNAPLPANFHQRPLKEIVAHINDISELRVVVDWYELGQEGVWPDTPATLRAQQTLAALGEMLTTLRLAMRVVDGRTVQITSMAALRSRYDVQLYRIGDLLPGAEAAAPLIANIKSRVAEKTWQSAGGSGAMHYDAASGYLIVRQTQGVQELLESTFAGLREEKKEKK